MLAANAPGLTTLSLRPRFVWGPGDRSVSVPVRTDKARRELDYTPQVGVDEGLAALHAARPESSMTAS